MIKGIIFDFGGVLAMPGGTKKLRRKYSKLLKISTLKFDAAWFKNWDLWRKGKINEKTFWENIIGTLNIDYDRKKIRKMMLNYQTIKKDAILFANKLRKRYKVVALTNHVKEWFEFLRKKHNIDNYFDNVFTSYELGVAKPSPRIYKLIAKKMNMKPSECVFVDDKFSNVLGARAAGMNAIHFKNFSQMKNALKKLGVEIE